MYRVLEIPPSMRPLIYDFGQLSTNTEYSYTLQIVSDHVSNYSYSLTGIFVAADDCRKCYQVMLMLLNLVYKVN